MTISEFMVKKDYTHEDFAALIDVSVSIVRLWECRATSPRLVHALKIRKVSGNKIKFEEMMSFRDLKGFDEWK